VPSEFSDLAAPSNVRASLTNGVGHNPPPQALVMSAGIGARYASVASHIPHCGQIGEDDSGVSASKEPWDVFQLDSLRSNTANDIRGCWPHVSFVAFGKLFSGNCEWLAGKARCNHVRNSSILVGCTGLCELTHVSEDWRGWQDAVADTSSNDSLAILVPLDIADWAPSE
jgi:hypothetical protein